MYTTLTHNNKSYTQKDRRTHTEINVNVNASKKALHMYMK
jgi:hypothetical protein